MKIDQKTLSHQPVTDPLPKRKGLHKSDMAPTSDTLDTESSKVIKSLKWMNGGHKALAERRTQILHKNSLPYIIAQQEIGKEKFFLDGDIALDEAATGTGKIFNNEGASWSHEKSITRFYCLLPNKTEIHPIGTADDLFKKGINGADISILFRINSYYDKTYEGEYDDPVLDPLEALEWHEVARATFYLLSATGEILPKDEKMAEEIWKPLTDERKGFAMTNVMGLSAGNSHSPFLKLALRLGFDPNKYSRLVECTPLEHAAKSGNEKGRQLILAHMLKATIIP